MLMKHGAQLHDPVLYPRGTTCIAEALSSQREWLVRAVLSCPDKMTYADKKSLQKAAEWQYEYPEGVISWLAMLSAMGLEVVQYLGQVLKKLPQANWAEVSCWWIYKHQWPMHMLAGGTLQGTATTGVKGHVCLVSSSCGMHAMHVCTCCSYTAQGDHAWCV
jgi:hypothetical protein